MSWEAIGAVAELLGAIGVIVSLIYLATQIRQNIRSLQATAFDTVVQTLAEEHRMYMINPEFADRNGEMPTSIR